ncbi:hypothetical protein MOO45_07290 [Bombilactobacillus folatiphilus]|uniref:Uncharacterized protein n=1 Tax=Bombilactobacillus folatiphilus TaxID=2923362 RepID=A0ABY4P8S0_9LACO|nr:hypothetical protein [Bombilactobacillus folatiphilus]UQS81985.1 hypothetical protein MOO45_07290 [Bombilactobacillus folatiphilus]
MIQTGHASGQCTPEEAMVIANMIYYTSTLDTTTTGEDRTLKDTANPNAPMISNTGTTEVFDSSSGQAISPDQSSYYYYRVLAKQSGSSKQLMSDVVKQKIHSGLKGYI